MSKTLEELAAEEKAAWEAYVDSVSLPMLPTADYDPEQAAARKAWAAANDALDAALEEYMR